MSYSASALDTYQTCPRMYKYKYLDKLKEPETPALKIGKEVDVALEWWPMKRLPGTSPYTQGILDAVKPVPWTILNPHAKFKIETAKGEIKGELDGIVWYKGASWILERKTTSLPIPLLVQLKTFDRQTTLYYYGARSLGHEPVGIILDVIAKPRIRQGVQETDNQYRGRVASQTVHEWHELRKTEHDLEVAEKEIEDVIDLIQLGKYPKNPTACYKYNKLCPFFAQCASS